MRKIGNATGRAVLTGTPRIIGNTRVEVVGETVVARLHGNAIVRTTPCVGGRRVVEISLAGGPTQTTRSRINDVLAVLFDRPCGELLPRLWQAGHVQFLRNAAGEVEEIGSSGWYVAGIML